MPVENQSGVLRCKWPFSWDINPSNLQKYVQGMGTIWVKKQAAKYKIDLNVLSFIGRETFRLTTLQPSDLTSLF